MNTPKTRGLKQYLISLKLYNNNCFIDGKKLEMSHIAPKALLKKFCNHKGPLKYFQSKKCFQKLAMLYIFNGGKWGKDWKYSIGTDILKLKHPCKPNEPHPFIEDWFIPQPRLEEPKVVISQLFAKCGIKAQYWKKLFNNYHDDELLQRLQQYFNLDTLTFDDLLKNHQWEIQKIKSFHFNDSFKSFQTTFVEKTKKILVKINDAFIMESKDCIQFTYQNESIALMYGQYWPICHNLDNEKWCNDEHKTMDFIRTNEVQNGWNFLINISEPVFLIHDCVLFSDKIKKTIPKEFRPQNTYDWVQNMIYYSNRIHEYCETVPHHKVQCPCGPKYVCYNHLTTACRECTISKGEYPQDKWDLVWYCNEKLHNKKWILDSKNGLSVTTMKTTSR